jgi:hypothetical protein
MREVNMLIYNLSLGVYLRLQASEDFEKITPCFHGTLPTF